MDLDLIASRIASDFSSQQPAKSHTAGVVEFKRDTGPLRRDIRTPNFHWDPDSFKILARVLWATKRSHSYAMDAYKYFSKLPSSSLSPDGMLGGRGYIQNIKDMRSNLSNAVEVMSSVVDTIQDEMNGSHWKSSNAQPDAETVEMINDSQETSAHELVQTDYQENVLDDVEEESIEYENPSSDDMNPHVEVPEEDQFHFSTYNQQSVLNPVRAFRASSNLPSGVTPAPYVNAYGPATGNEAGNFNDPSDMYPSDDESGNSSFSGVNESVPLYDYSFPTMPLTTIGDRSTFKVSGKT